MPRFYQGIMGILLAGALTACASTRYPTPYELPLVLDAQSNPLWSVEHHGRSGATEVTFRARESNRCGSPLLTLQLREQHRDRRSMDALSLSLQALSSAGLWTLSARYREADGSLSTVYDDRGLPLSEDNVILVRWHNKRELRVVVNGEVFIDGGFGERVRFVDLTSHCGVIDIIDVREA